MRGEAEMYRLLMDAAEADDRILAVYMNGSRTNVNVPADIFQDYDIVYVVRETGSLLRIGSGSADLEIFYICSIPMRVPMSRETGRIFTAG